MNARSFVAAAAAAACLILPAVAMPQSITLHAWKLETRQGPADAAGDARITVTPAPYTRTNPRDRLRLVSGQAVSLEGAPPAVDVTIRQPGYHPVPLSDLLVAAGRDHVVHVQIVRTSIPLSAPECFAFKTQYEQLFRKEEQLAPPGMPTEVIQRGARLKYADGILALPNPNRYDLQPLETRRMLDEMPDDRREELEGMLKGLFDVFGMEEMDDYVPSEWTTQFDPVDGQGPVDAIIRLNGTSGTCQVGDRVNELVDVDIGRFEGPDGELSVIRGRCLFIRPNGDESFRTFEWVIDENDSGAFRGTYALESRPNQQYEWSGRMVRGPGDFGGEVPQGEE